MRRVVPKLAEPPGRRKGSAGTGLPLRLLVAGDSGAAAVGVSAQSDGLCGQLVRALSPHHRVHWCVQASNGLDSAGLMKRLQDMPGAAFDVVVLSMGANDATRLQLPVGWALRQSAVAQLIAQRFKPRLLMHSAVPPMHACRALPQPLRWFMGMWARQMNLALAAQLGVPGQRSMHWHPQQMLSAGMSLDHIHPNAAGYAAWAQVLATFILASTAAQAQAFTSNQG